MSKSRAARADFKAEVRVTISVEPNLSGTAWQSGRPMEAGSLPPGTRVRQVTRFNKSYEKPKNDSLLILGQQTIWLFGYNDCISPQLLVEHAPGYKSLKGRSSYALNPASLSLNCRDTVTCPRMSKELKRSDCLHARPHVIQVSNEVPVVLVGLPGWDAGRGYSWSLTTSILWLLWGGFTMITAMNKWNEISTNNII